MKFILYFGMVVYGSVTATIIIMCDYYQVIHPSMIDTSFFMLIISIIAVVVGLYKLDV